MCGIVGYAGGKSAAGELFEGLKKLEYRGYDSAGISTLGGGSIFTIKKSGRVEGLAPRLGELKGCVGIGHTRWATHGEANDVNAHPHIYGSFSIVHNGIIENYAELKAELSAEGQVFFSHTDSEVIAHLLDYYYNGNFAEALSLACSRLKGCWAIAALCKQFQGFAVTRHGSPAILGEGEDGFFVASDMYALMGRARSYCILVDGDIALVTPRGISIYDGQLQPVARNFSPLEWEEEEVGTGGCPHYMLKEIRQNARTVRATCRAFSSSGCGGLCTRLKEADKIVLVGCGTAYNAALAAVRLLGGAYECPVSAHIASEARYDPPRVTQKSVCIAVSQSGETADTIMAAKILKDGGAYLIAVTNVGYSAITRFADKVVPVCAGAEVCVAATKSYIGQLACFHMLAAPCSPRVRCGALMKIADDIERVVSEGVYAANIASLCVKSRAVFFLGRGADVDIAVEGSLKLKEVSYIFSDGYPAGELKHGTLALIDENVLSVVLICDESLCEKSKTAVEQILSRKGKVAVITTLPHIYVELSARISAAWLLPCAPSHLSHFLSATALQLIAYHAAVMAGRDPDKPRNLAKSVTVE